MENITYDEFIQNILDTRGRFGCGDEYHERHHITPKCLGGRDKKNNLIDLLAREHFIAHKLLAEEHPDNDKLIYAYWMMAHIGRVEVSAEEYEDARIACGKAMSEARQGWYIGENNPNYRNYWTDEQRKHMSEVKSNPSQETRNKMSEAGKRRMANPENNPMHEKHHTEEAKRKIGEASRNRAPEVYERISQKMKERFSNPENRHMLGKHMTEEAKRKLSETRHTNHICEKITIQLTPNDEIVKIFWSTKQIHRELLIDSGDVSKCCNGKQKSAGGHHWKYLYDNELKNGEIIPGAITLGLITEEEALKQLKNST